MPLQEAQTEPTVNDKNWICIYPSYINAKRTTTEGRRIPKAAAIDLPTAQEINDVLKAAGLATRVEKEKMYPRDANRDMNFQGRVRVQIKNADGTVCDEKLATKRAVMLYAAETIPKLKSRIQKMGVPQSQAASQQAAAGGGGGKQKKKKK